MAKKSHFDIHASIVFQLGEHLITDAVQAVVELVKNSYDADASYCSLQVTTAQKADKHSHNYKKSVGYIIIEDDGVGMTPELIEKGFLIISNSMKREMKKKNQTTKKLRTPLGDKGLGRLSAQRLAENVEIFTKPCGSDTEYYVGFSWKDFENQERLTNVEVITDSWKSTRASGTRLVLSGLTEPEAWTGTAQLELTRDLSGMISPYKSVSDFMLVATINGVSLDLQEFAEKIRNTAQLRYNVTFDGSKIKCHGKARLDYIYPEKPEDKKSFQKLVVKDNGNAFFEFLTSQKAADQFQIKRSKSEGWFVEYSGVFDFSEIDKLKLMGGKRANPGPFKGEIDGFDLGISAASKTGIFDSAKEYRDTVRDIAGIRVYRDGFGVRVDEDWLGLGKQLTSAKSWYTLRPDNTIGYIAISAKDNAQLEETTDREGFRVTPYYDNFILIMGTFKRFSADAQSFIRRAWPKFREKYEYFESGYDEDVEPKTIRARAVSKIEKAQQVKGAIVSAKAAVSKAAISGSRSSMRRELKTVTEVLSKTEEEVGDVESVKRDLEFLENQIISLKEQMALMYEAVGLGLTAEALSHEMRNVSDQLAVRNSKVSKHLMDKQIKDAILFAHVEFINTSINALKKQLAHLAPSLRYVREKRERLCLSEFCDNLIDFYVDRFLKAEIKCSIKVTRDFTIRMNQGKLNQVLDNLLLNSEYWLREDVRTGNLKQGKIEIEVSKPFVRVSDNGRGFDKSIEPSLFEPFVTTKAKGVGRGLGLFIVSQLLDSEGCKIELLPERNKSGKRYILELNMSGALNDS